MNNGELLKGWFDAYVREYPVFDPAGREAYELKIGHSLRVAENSVMIGESLDFNGGDLALAEAIGLLHDIGRFEQFRRYRTFRDGKSENHALLGAAVLKENNVLTTLGEDEQRLILSSVSCHNMLGVPTDLPRGEDLFCRLIRDADKIDIMGVVSAYYESGQKSDFIELDLPDDSACSTGIVDDLFMGKTVDMKKMQTLNDFKLLQLGWVHDLNFPLAARMIDERGYLETIRRSLPASEKIDELLVFLKRHLASLGSGAC